MSETTLASQWERPLSNGAWFWLHCVGERKAVFQKVKAVSPSICAVICWVNTTDITKNTLHEPHQLASFEWTFHITMATQHQLIECSKIPWKWLHHSTRHRLRVYPCVYQSITRVRGSKHVLVIFISMIRPTCKTIALWSPARSNRFNRFLCIVVTCDGSNSL